MTVKLCIIHDAARAATRCDTHGPVQESSNACALAILESLTRTVQVRVSSMKPRNSPSRCGGETLLLPQTQPNNLEQVPSLEACFRSASSYDIPRANPRSSTYSANRSLRWSNHSAIVLVARTNA